MDFADKVREFSYRLPKLAPNVHTEEATKNAMVMPFISMLGYDVFNPEEVTPELHADVGVKKGEKVDYAILTKAGKAVVNSYRAIELDTALAARKHLQALNRVCAERGVLPHAGTNRGLCELEYHGRNTAHEDCDWILEDQPGE